MEITLYADVLFIIDLSMDLLSLYFTGRMTHIRMKPIRLSIAAAAGGVASVIAVLISPGVIADGIISVATSVVMCRIAFGFAPFAEFIRRASVLWASGLILGGIMTALNTVGGRVGLSTPRRAHTFLFILPAAVLAIFILRNIGRVSTERRAVVHITVFGKCAEFTALVDSGNLLADPFTGEPVIVASVDALGRILNDGEIDGLVSFAADGRNSKMASRIHLIPASDVSGEFLLHAIRPDAVIIGDKRYRALIAAAPREKEFTPGIDCIIPQDLVPLR